MSFKYNWGFEDGTNEFGKRIVENDSDGEEFSPSEYFINAKVSKVISELITQNRTYEITISGDYEINSVRQLYYFLKSALNVAGYPEYTRNSVIFCPPNALSSTQFSQIERNILDSIGLETKLELWKNEDVTFDWTSIIFFSTISHLLSNEWFHCNPDADIFCNDIDTSVGENSSLHSIGRYSECGRYLYAVSLTGVTFSGSNGEFFHCSSFMTRVIFILLEISYRVMVKCCRLMFFSNWLLTETETVEKNASRPPPARGSASAVPSRIATGLNSNVSSANPVRQSNNLEHDDSLDERQGIFLPTGESTIKQHQNS